MLATNKGKVFIPTVGYLQTHDWGDSGYVLEGPTWPTAKIGFVPIDAAEERLISGQALQEAWSIAR